MGSEMCIRDRVTSGQRLNQHVCEDDGAHAVVERAQGSACPRPRAAAADQQLARASFFLLARRLVRAGHGAGRGAVASASIATCGCIAACFAAANLVGRAGGSRCARKKVIALWLSRAPMLFFDPPGVFGLKLPKAFVPKGVGEE